MPITVFTGLPGSGKSLRMAQALIRVLRRNEKIFKKHKILRKVYSNLHLSDKLTTKYAKFIAYWENPEELIQLRDCDVFWDEIATHLDSTQWKELPLEIKRWLQQHRKLGVEIYANTQNFSTIDVSFRRLTNELYYMYKLCGSPDKSATRPKINYIWGAVVIRSLDPQNYKEEEQLNQMTGFSVLFITRDLVEAFDTTQEILPGKYPPLRHVERTCIDPNCNFHKIIHI